jgi:hypothetical protein
MAGPAFAVTAVAALVCFLPTSGPAVQIRWNSSVEAARRELLERRLGLINPTLIEETRWGYVLDETSPRNVAMIANLPFASDVNFIQGDPPRLDGPSIIRMAGPLAVQSYVCLVLGGLMLIGSLAPTRGWRQGYFFTACALLLAGAIWTELPLRASHEIGAWMGDYNTYTEDRAHFEGYFGYQGVRFHFHLGGFVLNLLDRALGATASSPATAFLVMSWLAGGVFLAGALAVAVIEDWTAEVMRYLGLSMAAPLTLSFFGYRELGYLALSVAAFPLLLRGLTIGDERRRTGYLSCAAVIQGLRAALHGFGLVGLGGSMVAAGASMGALRFRLHRVATVLVWGFAAYLIWLAGYLIVLGQEIVPGHAAGIPFRPLIESFIAEHREVSPILSVRGLRDIGLESLMVGVPVLLLGLSVNHDSAVRRIAWAFSIPSLLFLVLFWPAQGIGVDADAVFAAFPAYFAGAWMCARRRGTTAAAFAMLAVAHGVFWFLIRNNEFLNLRV